MLTAILDDEQRRSDPAAYVDKLWKKLPSYVQGKSGHYALLLAIATVSSGRGEPRTTFDALDRLLQSYDEPASARLLPFCETLARLTKNPGAARLLAERCLLAMDDALAARDPGRAELFRLCTRRAARRAKTKRLAKATDGFKSWVQHIAKLESGKAAASPSLTHGVASGEVTSSSALLWGRCSETGTLHGRLAETVEGSVRELEAPVQGDRDNTARIPIEGLEPATRYDYQLWCVHEGEPSQAVAGSFRTAPDESDPARVHFVWSGDLGGQNYCRHSDHGYRIFAAMAALDPHFFIANGDMIYADSACREEGPEEDWVNLPGAFSGVGDPAVDWTDLTATREVFLAHWRYNRSDPHILAFNRRVPMIVQWDDHEVINDFGAEWPSWNRDRAREGYPRLVEAGLRSFFDFHPIAAPPDDPYRIYRSFRWGRAAEIFVLDARSYRSPNEVPDATRGGKTMLGAEQLAWLREGLAESTAVWKIVSSDVPLAIPTGTQAEIYGSDAWAAGGRDEFSSGTGFQNELDAIVGLLDSEDIVNVVFITTDVHLAAQFRYAVDADGDGDVAVFHELVAGPLNAGMAPSLSGLDTSLRPVVLYAEGSIFNFGVITVEEDAAGRFVLETEVRDDLGHVRPGSRLRLEPEQP